MSDPVTNVEIEDVLSSIRRLVSENSKPSKSPVSNAAESVVAERSAETALDSPAATGAEMLVLTPALRVAEAESSALEGGADRPDGEDDAALDLSGFVDRVIESEVNEALDEVVTEALAEGPVEHDADPYRADADTEDTSFDDAERAAGEDEAAERLAARIAELEAVVAGREEQWEPDGNGEGDYAGAPVESLNWEDHEFEAPETGVTELDTDVADAEFVDVEEPSVELEGEGGDEMLATPAPTEEDFADLSPEHGGSEGDAVEEIDNEPDLAADLQEPWARDEARELPDFLNSDDEILDEDTLRDMVAEIVRQELQGTLGERITRNVRKLVRREIHRALAAQELD